MNSPASSMPTPTAMPMVRPSCTSRGSGAGTGIETRCPEINSRCVFTPYGVQVISVTRSSPGAMRNFEVSSGRITEMLSTLYPKVSPMTSI